jgi:hypothetical protein
LLLLQVCVVVVASCVAVVTRGVAVGILLLLFLSLVLFPLNGNRDSILYQSCPNCGCVSAAVMIDRSRDSLPVSAIRFLLLFRYLLQIQRRWRHRGARY